MWDCSVYWLEDPEHIALEIIPPTQWPEAAGACLAVSPERQTAMAGASRGDPGSASLSREAQCRAIAVLAAALHAAARNSG
jgi:hypothetical protein